MKLSASFLLFASAVASSQAHSSVRGLSEVATIPTASVTSYLPTYNDTDDDVQDLPEGPGFATTPDGATGEEISSPETAVSNMTTSEGSTGPNESHGMPNAKPNAEFAGPERNDTMAPPPPATFDGESNETSTDDDGYTDDGADLPLAQNASNADGPPHEKEATDGNGHPSPPDFQDLVDKKCSSYDCSAVTNSTCLPPPEPFTSNAAVTDGNVTEGRAGPDGNVVDGNNVTEGNELAGPDGNVVEGNNGTEGNGLAGPGSDGHQADHGPNHAAGRALKPPKPEDLLACACCENITVDEFNATGVDVSGLAWLVGYDSSSMSTVSAVTASDNGSNMNSLVFSSVIALVATVLSAFL